MFKEAEIWIKFACAAISATDGLYYDKKSVKDECAAASAYADEMMEQFYKRFPEEDEL